MQLAIISCLLFILVCINDVKAQIQRYSPTDKGDLIKGDTTEIGITDYSNPDWQTIDIDFLSSYYAQDGNNGAVTGGIGTEQLTDFTQKVILKIPTTKKLTLNLDGGYDYYSSASTDNIDNIRSSDSSSDVRMHGNVGLNYQYSDTKSIGLRVGGSTEYDYYSFNGGISSSFATKDKNTLLNIDAQAFIDQWVPYFPSELRRTASVPTTSRNSFNGSIGIGQVLNKRMQLYFQLEGTYMKGLLSTPFHRVYFQEQDQARIENLPDTRLKVPIGLRLNTHISDKVTLRTYYRFYWDNWGVQGQTFSVEVPIKLNQFLVIYPFYRYHQQTASNYFAPYKAHSVNDTYYTSDYDLSALSSHAYGLGVSYSPANGIAKIKLPFKKRPAFVVKSIDLKYSHYDRSTGLTGDVISLGMRFSF